MNKKSFTLVELVVAMSIVLIISTIGTINYLRSYDTLKLDAAAQRIASDIRYAQGLVIDRNAQARAVIGTGYLLVVDFSTSPSLYHIVRNRQNIATGGCAGSGNDSTIAYAPITDPLTQQALELHFDASDEYKGVTISNLNFGASVGTPAHAISFSDPAGQVNTGFWFCFSGSTATFIPDTPLPGTGGTITLAFRGKTKTIRISQTIGRVTIE